MKLSKAVEILNLEVVNKPIPWEEDFSDAVKLLIEAGKVVQKDRQTSIYRQFNLLPGETEY